MLRKFVAAAMALLLVAGATRMVPVQASVTGHTAHTIATGTSWDGNPLKGFLPFDGSTAAFPHSMEWFYIPVRDVMTGMNTFNWTALDNHLNAVSGRGHQAVFRFYLDYPAMSTGVPQFLIDGGLTMRSYSEYGGGQCPDYSNQNLRTAMQNFIAALGARYDGNAKVGFITVGMLGFWGEWHCYPYDSDTSDGKANWEPNDTVKNEVLTAFDNAFSKTPLLLRYPAANAPNMNFGYHDDSFAWETLNTNSWNFTSRLIAAGVQNKWQQQPVGGELRPEIQDTIFETTPWTGGNGEKWTDCVSATHVSWLMNEAIKRYTSGSAEYNNALAAAKQTGYDFRVDKAWYDNLSGSSSSLYLGIDLKNIGTAPFYYGSNTWPVRVGVKQNGTLVSSWTTGWNLNSVAADGLSDTFEFTTPSGCGLASGTYNMCIMVQNPLSNGNKLGFANAGQNADGWLDLGTFTVGAAATPTPTPTPTPTATPGTTLNLDNFDGTPAWPGSNDLGKWTGANSFANGGGAGALSSGALTLQYSNNGWYGSDVLQDISAYSKLVVRIKGAAGGEQSQFHLSLGGVDKTFAAFSGNTITTAYKDIAIDLAANGVNRTSPGQLNMTFWYGSSGTVSIDSIYFSN